MKQLAIFLIIFFLKINVFSQTRPCAWFTVCATNAWDAELAANPKPIAFVDYVDTLINPVIFKDSAVSEIWNSVSQELPLNKFVMTGNRRTPLNAEDFTGSVKVLYDQDYLYLLVSIKDNNINIADMSKDHLRIYVVPYPNECPEKVTKHWQWSYWINEGAHNFEILLNGVVGESFPYSIGDGYFPYNDYLGTLVDVVKNNTGYQLEIGINFAEGMRNTLGLPFPAGPDTAMGFNVTVMDYDTNDAGKYIQAAWSSTNNDIWATNLYCGILKFKSGETGVKYSNAYDVSISPNPVNDILTIKGINSGEIKIINIMGVEVLKVKIEPQINVSKLATGVYFVMVYDTYNKLVSIQKLIKY